LAIENIHGSTVNMRFITGIRESMGTNIYRTVSLGRVNHDASAGAIMACIAELVPVIGWPLFSIERRMTYRLEF
jgi:hypothetical protein